MYAGKYTRHGWYGVWYFSYIYPLLISWSLKHPWKNCCFHWMIPNLYIGNGCFTKHPLKIGCLGFQDLLYQLVSRICTSTCNQGKAPPPPVAKGAGKVAFLSGGVLLEKSMGFLFVITEFCLWEETCHSWDWLMFVFLIFDVISVNSCFFFWCVSYVYELLRSPWNQEMNPDASFWSFETKRIDRVVHQLNLFVK